MCHISLYKKVIPLISLLMNPKIDVMVSYTKLYLLNYWGTNKG